MNKAEIQNLMITIEEEARYIEMEFGRETVDFILSKYSASSIDAIRPSDLWDVFGEFDAIATDLR